MKFLNKITWLIYWLVAVVVCLVFFWVGQKLGFTHFDTYQYSASVGYSDQLLRPKLLGVGDLGPFRYGGEMTFPGLYWFKLVVFSVLPYSLILDQMIQLLLLIVCGALVGKLLQVRGWSSWVAVAIGLLFIVDSVFHTNVSGTRPETLTTLCLVSGLCLARGEKWNLRVIGGIFLGYAGVCHVYGFLLGPAMGLAACFSTREGKVSYSGHEALALIAAGVLLPWGGLGLFWVFAPGAWEIFTTNLEVQRGFHANRFKFFSYLRSYKLYGGWFLLILIFALPFLQFWKLEKSRNAWMRRAWAIFAALGALLIVPVAYFVLGTDQYFYGVLVLAGLVGTMAIGAPSQRLRQSILGGVVLLALGGNMVRLPVRLYKGYQKRELESANDLQRDWIDARLPEGATVFYFTRDWTLFVDRPNLKTKLYTFPLPMEPDLVADFELNSINNAEAGSFVLYDRDYTEKCPFHNQSSFDPKRVEGWEFLESKEWHYDLDKKEPLARHWELWIKRDSTFDED